MKKKKAEIMATVETDCKDPNAFAIEIEGDSMEPEFKAGDLVVFAPSLEPRSGQFVCAKTTDGTVYFKRFERTGPEGSTVRLVSTNPNYQPIELDASQVVFMYPAWELKRRFQRF